MRILIFTVLIVRSAFWLKLKSSHFRKYCEENFYQCVKLVQNHMEIFSTTTKLFVWRLRLRAQKAQSPHYWHMDSKNLKSVNHYKYLGTVLDTELSKDKKLYESMCNGLNICQTKYSKTTFSCIAMHSLLNIQTSSSGLSNIITSEDATNPLLF